MTKIKVLVKWVPILENEYRYGVLHDYRTFSGPAFHEDLLEYLPDRLKDVKYQGDVWFGVKTEHGVYFKTEELALEYAPILQEYLQNMSNAEDAKEKAEEIAKKKLGGGSKLLHIIPESWSDRVRIFFNR